MSTALAKASRPAADETPVEALDRLLDSLVSVLMDTTGELYTARPFPGVSGSVGEHVRHVLDHVSALLQSDPSRSLSYDHRQRGTLVESDPGAALRQVFRLKASLRRWSDRPLDAPILVRSMVSSSGASVAGWSTLARELAFVISHTIHHQALVAVLLATASLEVPDGLGYAPSTPRFAGA